MGTGVLMVVGGKERGEEKKGRKGSGGERMKRCEERKKNSK